MDLFSGIGGFSLALRRAIGEENIGYTGYSDIDKYANQVFKRRFPNAEKLGSVTDVQPKDLPERIDLITFGSPCQDFSIAGKRGGIQANRSSLFFEAMRIIRAKKPKYFIFENVKGLFSSGGGEDFTIVLREIADSGYDGGWELLNSRKQQIPKLSEQRIQQDKCHTNTLTARYEAGGAGSYIVENQQKGELNQIGTLGKDSEATRVYDSNGLSKTIKDGGGMGAKTGLYKIGSKIRRLTPVECSRLQGFPDDWNDCCSDSQRYKQMGNSITVNVAEEIFRKLYKNDYIISSENK